MGKSSMNYSNVGPISSKRWDRRKVKVIKEWGTGKILETNNWIEESMTHLIQITRK